MASIPEMFHDMTKRIMANEGFINFLHHQRSRPLRCATMCSGTEAPMLALELFAKSKSHWFAFKTFLTDHCRHRNYLQR